MSEKPTSLTWWPKDPAKWLTKTASLSVESRAAFDYLRCHAWLAHSRGQRPCSVPADDASLARLAGTSQAAWRKVAPTVLSFFTRMGEVYVDTDLLRIWDEQLRKYNKRANAGGKGGKAKAQRKHSGSNATTELKHQDRSSSLREERTTGTGALAPEDARAVPSAEGPYRDIRQAGGLRRITDILRDAGVPEL